LQIKQGPSAWRWSRTRGTPLSVRFTHALPNTYPNWLPV